MPDFRVAETAPEHPKLRAAGLAAAGLWSMAGGYAMRELTDGWVPDYWVQTWPAGKKHAATLVKVGLWTPQERSGIPGYRFHDWHDIQRAAAAIHAERAEGRERARRSREKRRSGERPAEASDAVTPDVRPESHDSLSLTQELTQLQDTSASSERGNANSGRATARPLPDGWAPHAGHQRTAAHRRVNIEHETTQFVAHAQAHGRTAVDWDAAFSVWLGSAKPTTGGAGNPWVRTSNGTDQHIADLIRAGQNGTDEQRAIEGP